MSADNGIGAQAPVGAQTIETTPTPQAIIVRTNTAQLMRIEAELSKLICCCRCVDNLLPPDAAPPIEYKGLESAATDVLGMLASFLPMTRQCAAIVQ